ncbi:YiiX/YebB-like N1pC/P60 family cysteine hydrolase [Paludibacter jiangxiensis]|uniref:YiiX/YebB-like N1pC/P60 family cysteine hydrolase n=1 Tax=Paludibacter jiangxiensis TaxID=681398 RepID=UPI00155E4896|nr:YiiX/YebB-like N1pC/P60 family cysteine hydrolase [Paludibacter jiangxiensis]
MKRFVVFQPFLLFLFITGSCFAQQKNFATLVKEGDIVFQHLNGGELGRAIDKVTRGYRGRDYNHCGLVVRVGDSLIVVEAIGKNVHLTTIKEFEGRCSETDLLVGRLKPKFSSLIVKAEKAALALQGVPYDDYFEMDNGRLYCSELIYEAFKMANDGKPFFVLKPMTFKDPDTGKLFPSWVEYYKNLNFSIPQGKPGINPGLLSHSSRLILISVSE